MRSIQSHLIGWLTAALLACSLITGGGLCVWLRHTLIEAFDQSLALRASTLQSLVTVRPSGEIEVETDLLPRDNLKRLRQSEFVQFQDAAGHVLSSSTGSLPLPPEATGHGAFNVPLPSGRTGRGVSQSFLPALEDDSGVKRDPAPNVPQVRITVVQDRHELDETLAEVTLAVGCAALMLSAAAVIGSVVIVRRGLSELRQLSARVEAIDAEAPTAGIADASLPNELRPISTRIDDLLSRVARTITRERQFSVAASHELRTPIAELLVVTDVALRDAGDVMSTTRALNEANAIGREMQQMVTTLLKVARLTRTGERLPAEKVIVAPLVDRCIARIEANSNGHAALIRSEAGPEAVLADPDALRAILENLLANAVKYALPATVIGVTTAVTGATAEIAVRNRQEQLVDADLDRMFEPFWRKDSARAGGSVGLGLTLVRAYATAMGGSVRAALDTDGTFTVVITLPVADR